MGLIIRLSTLLLLLCGISLIFPLVDARKRKKDPKCFELNIPNTIRTGCAPPYVMGEICYFSCKPGCRTGKGATKRKCKVRPARWTGGKGLKCKCPSPTQASTPAGPTGLRIAAMLRPTRLVDEGEQVTLLCLSDGSPSPRFTWTRGNGAALPPAAVVDPATGTLVIGRVRPEDDGEYTCTAEDGVDVVSSSVSFDVCPDVRH
ncbi:myosin light chain kinase, smooth muscle-like [Branchiostoma floridae]|uniref:Myosin light chain kinase, smooth muscle-like n=1 Tax=Branchiostoma floridae TaxID=7739 RepID=A0A9J7KTA0_BRAFL|nr:myosin light chain kinase, smooth muscle-like [Branchiostoma floridae]